MAKSTPVLNSVALEYVGNIQRDTKRYESALRSANGTLNRTIYGNKREWNIEISEAPLSHINQLRAIAVLTSDITFMDEDGVFYTVAPDATFSESVEQVGSTRQYNATLKLLQV